MNKIITIGREFGSGGREIGIKLAEKLGLKFYDKELISLAAEDGNLDAAFIESHEEQSPSIIAGGLSRSPFASFVYQPSFTDTIFFKQCDTLKKIAEQGPCVIVGRCADYVLRDYSRLDIFISSSMSAKIARKRAMAPEKKDFTDIEMEKWITRINKGRRRYYEHYSGNKWGNIENYDLCIKTDDIGVDGAVEVILAYINGLK